MSAIQQLMAASGYNGPTDPNFANVSLLLHGDGANGSTSFPDSSVNSFSVSAYGNAQVSTVSPKFGTGSISLDGSGDYLTVSQNSAFNFGTGNFTVEAWVVRNTSTTGYETILGFDVAGGLLFQIFQNQLDFGIRNTASNLSGTTVPANQWVHLAITRQGSTVFMFQNGSLVRTLNDTTNFTNATQLIVGGYSTSAGLFNGYIDELRVTKGVARYTSSFTPPTEAFPNA